MTNKKGNRRKTGKEQYYTLPSIADFCVEEMIKLAGSKKQFLEPAGGHGDFIKAMLRNNIPKENIISFDIEPKHKLVKKQNFLEVIDLPNGLITLTNPPFGRANSLSKKFFNHAAKFSDYIGFIVPKSWRKWSVHNSLDLNFELIYDVDLPEVCFYSPDGEIHKGKFLKCIFQIWKRSSVIRKKIKIKDNGLIKKVSFEEADVALVVFGWGCGNLLKEFERKPNTTLMFLKTKNKKVIEALEKIDFSGFYNNVAYTQALSFSEINYMLNNYFDLKQYDDNNKQTELF